MSDAQPPPGYNLDDDPDPSVSTERAPPDTTTTTTTTNPTGLPVAPPQLTPPDSSAAPAPDADDFTHPEIAALHMMFPAFDAALLYVLSPLAQSSMGGFPD